MLPTWKVKNRIVVGRLEDFLPQLPDNFIDVTVTSPPYKDEDGYTPALMLMMFRELYRMHKPDTYAFVNFGHLVDFKARPFWLVQIAYRCGWVLHETFIWEKPQFSPVTSNKNVNNVYEFVFMFRKGKPTELDRLSIGVPYADKSNIKRYGAGKDVRCGGNIWRIGYDTIQRSDEKLHPHRFPEELPLRCLKLVRPSLPRCAVVCDPFGGSFTTAAVAKERGYDFISCECSLFNALTASYARQLPLTKLSSL